MCCNDNNVSRESNCECLRDILKVILRLQRREEKEEDMEGCDKPFLGPCPRISCFNTRPIQFYTCCSGTPWEFPFTLDDMTGTSSVFRVENLDECCCTCRILTTNPDQTERCNTPFVATDSFFTINLNCVGALKCLRDTFVPCI